MSTALSIMTNVGSATAQKNMMGVSRNLNASISRLSSGNRMNSAADDAAGVAVSTGLRAQLGGYNQAMRNANDGVAILQTAEGSYNSQSETLTRMRELAIQSGSDGLTDTERAYLDTEFQSHMSELDRVASVTEFNGQKLLDGTAGDGAGLMTFQVGTRNTADDRITHTLGAQDVAGLGMTGEAVDTLANSQGAVDAIDAALDGISTDRAELGATINQLNSSVDNLSNTVTNITAANGQIQDVDVAAESADFAKSQVLQQAGVAMLAQANQAPGLALRLLG